MDLFPEPKADPIARHNRAPLAERMRPQVLEDVIGQSHLLSPGKLLHRAIVSDCFSSLIFHGPPGVGKTSLAGVIAQVTKARFESLNAVEANVSQLRDCIANARTLLSLRGETTLLFIDEIHRFNTAQQDVLLPHIERGTVRFIGATTQNPTFALNSPLLSRSQLFQLEALSNDDLIVALERAITDEPRGFGRKSLDVSNEALLHLAKMSDGDVRKALSALEIAVLTTPEIDGKIRIDLAAAEDSIQKKSVSYDGKGDEHYDTISAFIKSIRGSDPDAALYWLARMLQAGEDPRFIARRLVISASEDIGLADSEALQVAVAAQQAFELVGLPEGRIPLAHATVYLATAPKSNSAYAALGKAQSDVENGRTLAVPLHLRTPARKKQAREQGAPANKVNYLYSHDAEENYVPQAYLPEGRSYFEPTENGREKRIKERLAYWKSLHSEQGDKS